MLFAGEKKKKKALKNNTRNTLQNQASSQLRQAFCPQQWQEDFLNGHLNSGADSFTGHLGWLSVCWGSWIGPCYLLPSVPALGRLLCHHGEGCYFWELRWMSKLKTALLWCCTNSFSKVLAPAVPLVAISSIHLGSCIMARQLLCCHHQVGCSCSVSGLILCLSSLQLPQVLHKRLGNGAKCRQGALLFHLPNKCQQGVCTVAVVELWLNQITSILCPAFRMWNLSSTETPELRKHALV